MLPDRATEAMVDLDPSSGSYVLPIPTRSVLVLFGESPSDDPGTFPCVLDSADCDALRPGAHLEARLKFFAADPGELAKPGSEFTLWYGGNIGTGVVTR